MTYSSIPIMYKYDMNYSYNLHGKRNLSVRLYVKKGEKRNQQEERGHGKRYAAAIESGWHTPPNGISPQVNRC